MLIQTNNQTRTNTGQNTDGGAEIRLLGKMMTLLENRKIGLEQGTSSLPPEPLIKQLQTLVDLLAGIHGLEPSKNVEDVAEVVRALGAEESQGKHKKMKLKPPL